MRDETESLTHDVVTSGPVVNIELIAGHIFALCFIDAVLMRDDGGLYFWNVFFRFLDDLLDLVIEALAQAR